MTISSVTLLVAIISSSCLVAVILAGTPRTLGLGEGLLDGDILGLSLADGLWLAEGLKDALILEDGLRDGLSLLDGL
jgi:hypothetical protein